MFKVNNKDTRTLNMPTGHSSHMQSLLEDSDW